MLEKIAEYHNTWISYLRSLGCAEYNCEDLVQDMYLKVYDYLQKYDRNLMYNKDEINHYFFYITLQNLYYDSLRKKKVTFEELDDIELIDEEYYEQDITKEVDAILRWYNSSGDNVSENEYYRKIFEEVFIEKKSVSELSRESKITYWSLRNAVKIIRKQIQDLI
jgi:RNA polymerase sigma factor (sigma-70 family)